MHTVRASGPLEHCVCANKKLKNISSLPAVIGGFYAVLSIVEEIDWWLVLVNYKWKALTSWKCGFFSKLWEFSHSLTQLLHTPAVRVLSLWHGLDESDPTNRVSKCCRSSTVWPPRPPSLTASLFSRAGLWLVEKQQAFLCSCLYVCVCVCKESKHAEHTYTHTHIFVMRQC